MENLTKYISILKALAISIVLVFVFGLFINFAKADCVLTREQFKLSEHQGLITGNVTANGQAVVNNNTNCSFPLSLSSYKMYDRTLEKQVYFDGVTVNISPNSRTVLNVSLPSCMAQIDLYYGPIIKSVPTLDRSGTLLEWAYYQNNSNSYGNASGNFCTDIPETPELVVACSANPSSVDVGNSVSWTATVSGGTGAYTYHWTGTDGLSNYSQSASKIYSTAGTKYATVVITSGGRSISANCSVVVEPPVTPNLTGSCSASPLSVNVGGRVYWTATASGGTGAYTYHWTGTDGLVNYSQSTSKLYSTAGTKNATVVITSGTESINANCSANVNNNTVDDELIVTCSTNHSSVDVDEDVIWRATASGGDGVYDYEWTGTDDLEGDTRNVTWSYDNGGTKRGRITVTSGGQTAYTSCTVRVNEDEINDNLNVSCYASPATSQVGSRINWNVRVSGGDGNYDYDWSGTDGLNSSSRTPSKIYSTPGSKRATVTVTDGDGLEDSATCNANINSVLAFSQTYQPPMASAVYLSQIPYTGIADNYKLLFFLGVLALFSAWIAYAVTSYQKNNEVKS